MNILLILYLNYGLCGFKLYFHRKFEDSGKVLICRYKIDVKHACIVHKFDSISKYLQICFLLIICESYSVVFVMMSVFHRVGKYITALYKMPYALSTFRFFLLQKPDLNMMLKKIYF